MRTLKPGQQMILKVEHEFDGWWVYLKVCGAKYRVNVSIDEIKAMANYMLRQVGVD